MKKKAHKEFKVILKGTPAARGCAEGAVRIVWSAKDILRFREGNILVTDMTEPSMVVMMNKASAIVTDRGGLTCHAAIVSRELGIPCIVGAGEATKVLKEGVVVRVDGRTGEVYRLL